MSNRKSLLTIMCLLPLSYSCSRSSPQEVKPREQTWLSDYLKTLDCKVFDRAFIQEQSGNSLLLYVENGRGEVIKALNKQLPKNFKRTDGGLEGGFYDTTFENDKISISVTSDQKSTKLTLVGVVKNQ
jgi:hypothetical protein